MGFEVGDEIFCREGRKSVITSIKEGERGRYLRHTHKDDGSPDSCLEKYCTLLTDAKSKTKEGEGKNMFNRVKGYVERHEDVLFTLGLIVLLDHFLFKGALRERIKTAIEGMLKKAEERIAGSGS